MANMFFLYRPIHIIYRQFCLNLHRAVTVCFGRIDSQPYVTVLVVLQSANGDLHKNRWVIDELNNCTNLASLVFSLFNFYLQWKQKTLPTSQQFHKFNSLTHMFFWFSLETCFLGGRRFSREHRWWSKVMTLSIQPRRLRICWEKMRERLVVNPSFFPVGPLYLGLHFKGFPVLTIR